MNNEALRRKALAMGAKLEVDGKIFNAARAEGRHSAKVIPIKPPESIVHEVAPVAEKSTTDDSTKIIGDYAAACFLLAKEQSKVVESNQKLIALMTHQLTKPESSKSKSWVFKVNRDSNGNLTSIEAAQKD